MKMEKKVEALIWHPRQRKRLPIAAKQTAASRLVCGIDLGWFIGSMADQPKRKVEWWSITYHQFTFIICVLIFVSVLRCSTHTHEFFLENGYIPTVFAATLTFFSS
mmetsp:Transcript_866/g.1144  ORF Transcript_866/g.1144 Transcript_866/m.1144 type:complete len:106 (+) Transcript_866:730-1047(+)